VTCQVRNDTQISPIGLDIGGAAAHKKRPRSGRGLKGLDVTDSLVHLFSFVRLMAISVFPVQRELIVSSTHPSFGYRSARSVAVGFGLHLDRISRTTIVRHAVLKVSRRFCPTYRAPDDPRLVDYEFASNQGMQNKGLVMTRVNKARHHEIVYAQNTTTARSGIFFKIKLFIF
jgi:hypothetical protein